MIKVEGHQNLYRDEKSGAIINCDSVGYNQYQKKELDAMKRDIDEIKTLLRELINGSK